MKKIVMTCVIAALTLVACNKDDDSNSGTTPNSQLIVGTWTSVLIEAYTLEDATGDTASLISIPGPFFTFTFESNGNFTNMGFGDTATGTYSVNGNTLFAVADGDTISAEITTLTSSSLIFEEEDSYIDNSVSYTDHAYFEFQK